MPETAPADLVAFFDEPHDQSTTAVATRWLSDGQDRRTYLRPLGTLLWAPFAILAAPGGCDLWPTLPEQPATDALFPLATNVPYERLGDVLAANKNRLGRGIVKETKRRWRQMALYESDTESNAFLEWAYQPTRERLTRTLAKVFADAGRLTHPYGGLSANHLRWLLRLIGARVAWDKHWFEPSSRMSGTDILATAKQYPTGLRDEHPMEIVSELADIVAHRLGAIHLGAADGGLLSQLLQQRGLPRHLRQEWKIYPTPQHVAWRMVTGLPIEAIPTERRKVWDGTCGSGTFLVAALDRLRTLMPNLSLPELREYFIHTISGNDLVPALADVSRIALDLALGAPVGGDWRITETDVLKAPAWSSDVIPTIIIGNPPFAAIGHTPDVAISIINHYIELLPRGGLLSVIIPRSLLGTDAASRLRRRLLSEFEIYEVSEYESGTFSGTEQETAVLTARKLHEGERSTFAVTWREVAKDGQTRAIDALRQVEWLQNEYTPILPPLWMRMNTLFDGFPQLRMFVTKNNRSQGITPGIAGKGNIISHPEPGAVPYLFGREDMLPFAIPWHQHPRWLHYDPVRLQWARPGAVELFKSAKVFISRHVTWGSAWRIRAAVDLDGVFPSDQFIVMIPRPPLSMDFLAALFNSAMVNCLLGLRNPSNTVNMKHMLELPIPRDTQSEVVRRIEVVARELREGRQPGGILSSEHLAELTLELDSLFFDAYEMPGSLRHEIGQHFISRGDSRPGFDRPMVAVSDFDDVRKSRSTDQDLARMKHLFDRREGGVLSRGEESELERLVDRWQEAYAEAAKRVVVSASPRQPSDVA